MIVDPAEISKNVPAHIPIVGDAKDVLPKLTDEHAPRSDGSRLEEWWKRIAEWRSSTRSATRGLRGLRDQAAADDRGDVQGHRRRRGHHLRRRPAPDVVRAVLRLPRAAAVDQPGGLGTMGFGLPAAIGAASHAPTTTSPPRRRRQPDHGGQELATAKRHDIPVKVFYTNNGHPGMARQWQELFWDRRYSAVEMGDSPDWVLAEAFGGTGMRCTDKGEIEDAMQTALETDGPVLVDEPRDQGGELLPDDPRRRSRAGHGRVGGGTMGSWTPDLIKLEDPRRRAGSRAASTSCRCWRTSRACWSSGSWACSAAADSTSTRSRSGRPRTPMCRGPR